MSAEDALSTTLAAVVRVAIAATCRRYVGRCAEAVALRELRTKLRNTAAREP